jgi:hypothetical protein
MSVHPPYRPEFEQLDQRELPSALHLAGIMRCFDVNRTVSGTVSGLKLVVQKLKLGPLAGKATLTPGPIDVMGDHSGTLVFKTSRGNLTFSDTGHIDSLTQQFTETVTVSHGTQSLRGATGQLAVTGSLNVLADTFTANITGQVCIRLHR